MYIEQEPQLGIRCRAVIHKHEQLDHLVVASPGHPPGNRLLQTLSWRKAHGYGLTHQRPPVGLVGVDSPDLDPVAALLPLPVHDSQSHRQLIIQRRRARGGSPAAPDPTDARRRQIAIPQSSTTQSESERTIGQGRIPHGSALRTSASSGSVTALSPKLSAARVTPPISLRRGNIASVST